jgi:hypothetical protein
VAVSYPADGNSDCFQIEDDSFWFRHRNRCIVEAVRRFPPPGEILDVGGGNGFVARALIDAGYQTALLEPGPDGAANARKYRRIPRVINATLEDAGLAPSSVAAAGLFDVLEHVDDDRGLLGRLRERMQPGGAIYMTVPAHRWLWSRADVEAGHSRRYNRAELSKRVNSCGFDVLYSTYFFEALVIPLFVLRTLPFVLRISRQRSVDDYRTDHRSGGRLLPAMLAREVGVIARGGTLATGTSCLLIARKRA